MSTGIQYSARASTIAFASGQQKRAKYQDDSKNVSKVSVSRRPRPPPGSAALVKAGRLSSGEDTPLHSMSSGSVTDNCAGSSGTSVPLAS